MFKLRGRVSALTAVATAAGAVAYLGVAKAGVAQATVQPAVTAAPSGLVLAAGAPCAGPTATTTAVSPMSVLWDGGGGFYISVGDSVHSEVCHVDASGHISLAAGNGTPGYFAAPYGDNVAATGAELYMPEGLALAAGNLYIADSSDGRVRRVDSSGTITSVASGLQKPWAVAADGSGGLYIAAKSNNQVLYLSGAGSLSVAAGTGAAGYSGDGGPAASAQLNQPSGVAVGPSGVVYVSDSGNQRVRAIDPSGTIRTVAGTGVKGHTGDGGPAASAELNGPGGLSVDGAGDLFVADSTNAVIREITTSQTIATVAGTGVVGSTGDGGPATSAELKWPVSVSADPAGDLLIADAGASQVRLVSQGVISTVAGNGTTGMSGDGGPATTASLSQPTGVAVGAGGLYVADSWNKAVRLVGPAGTITTLADAADGLSFPVAVTVDPRGNVYVADYDNRVYEIYGATGQVRVVAGTGTAGYTGDGGRASAATLNLPAGLALDGAGNLYISDSANNVIREVDTSGVITTYAGSGFATSATHPLGDGGSASRATFNRPQGLYRASYGIIVADSSNQRIRLISTKRVVTTLAGTGQIGYTGSGTASTSAMFNFPAGVSLDATGNVLVADNGNCVIRSINMTNHGVYTVAGWGPAQSIHPTCGYIGSDGTQMLNDPTSVATAQDGTVYVADSLNNRVRSFVP